MPNFAIRVLSDVPDSSYFPEDVSPVNCQFTKELEMRDCKVCAYPFFIFRHTANLVHYHLQVCQNVLGFYVELVRSSCNETCSHKTWFN